MYRTLAITVLMMLAALPLAGMADEPDGFLGPTGIPFSGFVGGVEPEMKRLRMHFDLSEQQVVSAHQIISTHRESWERMYSLFETFDTQHIFDMVMDAGGDDELHQLNPELGPLRVVKYQEIMAAQSQLESRLVQRLKQVVEPVQDAAWQEYLITRDFERWRQPSWHEPFGETIDPLLLVLRVHPRFADDPTAEQAIKQVRKEAHALAAEMIVAYQLDEADSIEVFNRVNAADPERSSDLHERALVASFELASFLWIVPDRLAEAGFDGTDARRYHELFTEQQGLVSQLNSAGPIEEKIAGAMFVRNALKLPNLEPEQRDRLLAMWSEMQNAYSRASELHYKFNDAWMRTGGLYEREEYPSEIRAICREASKEPEDIASILTLPQWYGVLRDWGVSGRTFFEDHPAYETFDWSTLDFEALIPK